MYQYRQQKKTEKGSNAIWDFMDRLLSALRQQPQAETPENNTPKLENQPANLENNTQSPACAPSDALQLLASLSSGTLSTLMREKGLPDSDKYKSIDAFHHRVLFVAQALAPAEDETWQQLFERAYAVLYPSTQKEEREHPVSQTKAASVQDSTQVSTPETDVHNPPALEKQPQNPSFDGHTLPETRTHAEQITMHMLLNTS